MARPDLEPQPNGWTMPSPSRGGRGSRSRRNFARAPVMQTFKHLHTHQKREMDISEQDVYRAPPPCADSLFEARLVIAGEHLRPDGLDERSVLDNIRDAQNVWIQTPEPHIFEVTSRSMESLRNAVKALNWLLHDLRLADVLKSSSIFVQKPLRATPDAMISVTLASRPQALDRQASLDEVDNASVIEAFVPRMCFGINRAADSLKGLGKDLHMRVNFGRVNIKQKKKVSPDALNYNDFEKYMRQNVVRGICGFGVQMCDTHQASLAMQHLCDPSQGITRNTNSLTKRCNLTMVIQDRSEGAEVSVDLVHGQLTRATMKTPEERPRIDWTVMAPDRAFDWNFQVQAWDEAKNMPPDLEDFVQRITINKRRGCDDSEAFENFSIRTPRMGTLGTCISETRLRSSVLIPMDDEPYVIEVSLTRKWNGYDVNNTADITWGIEMYGVHWDEAVNVVAADGRRKDWGPDHSYIWQGAGEGLGERYGRFLRCVLKVQTVLDTLHLVMRPEPEDQSFEETEDLIEL